MDTDQNLRQKPEQGIFLNGDEYSGLDEFPEVYRPYFDKIMVPKSVIQDRVREMGQEIRAYFGDNPITCLVVLKGGFVFANDLAQHLDSPTTPNPYQLEFIKVKSYHNDTKGENVITGLDINTLKDKHVLILDDIFDSGGTIQSIYDILESVPLADLKTACFVLKRREISVRVRPDFVGVSIPNAWIAGYGMDHNEYLRNVQSIGVMSDYGKTELGDDS